MITHLRKQFNKGFTDGKYRQFLERLDEVCGTHVSFRVSETPVFIPEHLMAMMEEAGKDIIMQLMSNPFYLKDSERTIPAEYRVPNEASHPLFVSVDFGLVRNEHGEHRPMLIEMQGFPTLYAYQVELCRLYKEIYGLPREMEALPDGLDLEEYYRIFRGAVLGKHDPENVILLEIDPLQQKTLPDFILTGRVCGISSVNIGDVIKEGRVLYYTKDGKRVPVHRIYNRVIVDELRRTTSQLPFSFCDDLQVEWAGHPNWFFRLSKFSMPYLKHALVPKTEFLDHMKNIPDDLDRWVLKPLFSFAGSGVKVSPSRAEVDAVRDVERGNYILQQKVEYDGVVDTPHGPTKAEVRIIYIWDTELRAVNNLVRMGRGAMMGVDHNKNMMWVGSSAGFRVS
jgi:hypothetical protein